MTKILLDENISHKVADRISHIYSGSAPVKDLIRSWCQKILIFIRKVCFGDLLQN